MVAATFTGSDALLLAAIVVLLVLLALLAVAETGLNRISRHKAEAIAHDDPKRGRALLRLVEQPERFLNPVLADRQHPADRVGVPHHDPRRPAVRRAGDWSSASCSTS